MTSNLDNLTYGQIKELRSLLSSDGATNERPSIYSQYIGKYVICRTRNEGVNAGKVKAIDETGVVLEDARRLHYHKPLNKKVSWYEGIAFDGIDEGSRLSVPREKLIAEDYSLTVCSDEAEKSIRKAKNHEQS